MKKKKTTKKNKKKREETMNLTIGELRSFIADLRDDDRVVIELESGRHVDALGVGYRPAAGFLVIGL